MPGGLLPPLRLMPKVKPGSSGIGMEADREVVLLLSTWGSVRSGQRILHEIRVKKSSGKNWHLDTNAWQGGGRGPVIHSETISL